MRELLSQVRSGFRRAYLHAALNYGCTNELRRASSDDICALMVAADATQVDTLTALLEQRRRAHRR